MKNVGIIAEYNPFHYGHLYQIQKIKEAGAKTVTVCMSGNFVQRACPAVIEKHKRAAAAVMCGADLVIELPLRYSIASARDFAFGGVYLLDKTGYTDTLCFGSETGDVEKLKSALPYLEKAEEKRLIKKYLDEGKSFASSRDAALSDAKSPFIPRDPNDILAFEYIRAIDKIGSEIIPEAVKREGGYHDENGIYSATAIRKKLKENSLLPEDLPPESYKLLSECIKNGEVLSSEKFSVAVLSVLKRAVYSDKTAFKNLYALSEGLENRILKFSGTAKNLEDLYFSVKTKRYAMSAVRRGVASMLFGLEKHPSPPSYFHILAFNEKGRELLKHLKKTELPVYHTLPSEKDFAFSEDMKADVLADNLYSLCLEKPSEGGKSFTKTSVII